MRLFLDIDPLVGLVELVPDVHTSGPRKGRSRGLRSRLCGALLDLYGKDELGELTIGDLRNTLRADLVRQRNLGEECLRALEAVMEQHNIGFRTSHVGTAHEALEASRAFFRAFVSEYGYENALRPEADRALVKVLAALAEMRE